MKKSTENWAFFIVIMVIICLIVIWYNKRKRQLINALKERIENLNSQINGLKERERMLLRFKHIVIVFIKTTLLFGLFIVAFVIFYCFPLYSFYKEYIISATMLSVTTFILRQAFIIITGKEATLSNLMSIIKDEIHAYIFRNDLELQKNINKNIEAIKALEKRKMELETSILF